MSIAPQIAATAVPSRPAGTLPDVPSSTPANDTVRIPSSPGNQSSQTVQNLLAERRRRLEKDKEEKEAKEKAERKAKSDSRKDSVTADPNSAKAKQFTYAQQQRQRQQDARKERERILRQIEHDKAERKEKEELRKALAKEEAEGDDGAGGLVKKQLLHELDGGSSPAGGNKCAIQVRMLDGATIRNRFGSEHTLGSSVRDWVDHQRSDGDVPYTFKHILTPLPNRSLSISDEEESLRSLDLVPSATLIMVPVKDFTASYSTNQGSLSKGISALYDFFVGIASLVLEALATFLGLRQNAEPEQIDADSGASTSTSTHDKAVTSRVNVRTLQDQQDDREHHQLYNGNQVSTSYWCSCLL